MAMFLVLIPLLLSLFPLAATEVGPEGWVVVLAAGLESVANAKTLGTGSDVPDAPPMGDGDDGPPPEAPPMDEPLVFSDAEVKEFEAACKDLDKRKGWTTEQDGRFREWVKQGSRKDCTVSFATVSAEDSPKPSSGSTGPKQETGFGGNPYERYQAYLRTLENMKDTPKDDLPSPITSKDWREKFFVYVMDKAGEKASAQEAVVQGWLDDGLKALYGTWKKAPKTSPPSSSGGNKPEEPKILAADPDRPWRNLSGQPLKAAQAKVKEETGVLGDWFFGDQEGGETGFGKNAKLIGGDAKMLVDIVMPKAGDSKAINAARKVAQNAQKSANTIKLEVENIEKLYNKYIRTVGTITKDDVSTLGEDFDLRILRRIANLSETSTGGLDYSSVTMKTKDDAEKEFADLKKATSSELRAGANGLLEQAKQKEADINKIASTSSGPTTAPKPSPTSGKTEFPKEDVEWFDKMCKQEEQTREALANYLAQQKVPMSFPTGNTDVAKYGEFLGKYEVWKAKTKQKCGKQGTSSGGTGKWDQFKQTVGGLIGKGKPTGAGS